MDKHSLKETHKLIYPAILVHSPSPRFEFIIHALKDGDIPILLEDSGYKIEVARKSNDLIGIKLLIENEDCSLLINKEDILKITSLNDLIIGRKCLI